MLLCDIGTRLKHTCYERSSIQSTIMSLTLSALIVLVLTSLAKGVGVDLGDEQVANFVLTGGQLLGVIGVWFGRVRAGGITWWGGRK